MQYLYHLNYNENEQEYWSFISERCWVSNSIRSFGLRKLVSKHDHDDYYDYLTDRNSQKNDEADSVELNAYL